MEIEAFQTISRPSTAADDSNIELSRDEIIRTLEQEILLGRLEPGARIDERALSARFNVSRTPVRDALSRLASLGLVTVRPRSGSYVAEFELGDFFQISETMADLEGLCAAYAAERMDKSELAELRDRAQICEETLAAPTDAYVIANYEFHDAIYRGAKNKFLELLTRQTRLRIQIFRSQTFRLPDRLERSITEHRQIVAAIAEGDPVSARLRMTDHVQIRREEFTPLITLATARRRSTEAPPRTARPIQRHKIT